jgi:hypothetical protein
MHLDCAVPLPIADKLACALDGRDALGAFACDWQGHRAIKVNRRCKRLLDEIMAGYKYPEGKKATVDDMPEDGNDHACNALESWIFLRAQR